MISSVVWLYMVFTGHINPDKAPWIIYLPIVFIECAVYLLSLPKITDLIDRIRSKHDKNND